MPLCSYKVTGGRHPMPVICYWPLVQIRWQVLTCFTDIADREPLGCFSTGVVVQPPDEVVFKHG